MSVVFWRRTLLGGVDWLELAFLSTNMAINLKGKNVSRETESDRIMWRQEGV
jgi:hypothetical protein